MEADAHVAGFHIATTDDQHGMDFRFLGVLDFAVDFVHRVIGVRADEIRAEFGHDGFGVVHKRLVIANGEDAHLLGREPEREIPGIMLDEETDEPLVRA